MPVAAGGLRRPPDPRSGRYPPARSGIVVVETVRAGGHRPLGPRGWGCLEAARVWLVAAAAGAEDAAGGRPGPVCSLGELLHPVAVRDAFSSSAGARVPGWCGREARAGAECSAGSGHRSMIVRPAGERYACAGGRGTGCCCPSRAARSGAESRPVERRGVFRRAGTGRPGGGRGEKCQRCPCAGGRRVGGGRVVAGVKSARGVRCPVADEREAGDGRACRGRGGAAAAPGARQRGTASRGAGRSCKRCQAVSSGAGGLIRAAQKNGRQGRLGRPGRGSRIDSAPPWYG
ncbi:hypothetical protein JOF35_008798 [Streptomyces demainii]|uniref:Uncharacterized protein n=1 Tax=Streptomyces demainii TaxID=588122 RepID=A0ABT9L6U9_9ACTN|nr:hypothetical protein [Streptomyces demainii]